MSGSSIIDGMAIVFTLTTIAVVLYPIIRLTPSWLEGSLGKRIAFHRAAADALETALTRSHNDPAQGDRLEAQLRYHRASLATLAPSHPAAAAVAAVEARVDAAA